MIDHKIRTIVITGDIRVHDTVTDDTVSGIVVADIVAADIVAVDTVGADKIGVTVASVVVAVDGERDVLPLCLPQPTKNKNFIDKTSIVYNNLTEISWL